MSVVECGTPKNVGPQLCSYKLYIIILLIDITNKLCVQNLILKYSEIIYNIYLLNK